MIIPSTFHSIQVNCTEAGPDSSESRDTSLRQTGVFAHKGIVVQQDTASVKFKHAMADTIYTCSVETRFNNSDARATAGDAVSVHTLPASKRGRSHVIEFAFSVYAVLLRVFQVK